MEGKYSRVLQPVFIKGFIDSTMVLYCSYPCVEESANRAYYYCNLCDASYTLLYMTFFIEYFVSVEYANALYLVVTRLL